MSEANGTAERRTAEALLEAKAKTLGRITVGEDKAYDTSDHLAGSRDQSHRHALTHSASTD